METLVRGTTLVRRILRACAMMPFAGRPIHDGDDGQDAELRARADTIYHPAGTCRLRGDSGAVLDPQLRVRGVDKPGVADASIMGEPQDPGAERHDWRTGRRLALLRRQPRTLKQSMHLCTPLAASRDST